MPRETAAAKKARIEAEIAADAEAALLAGQSIGGTDEVDALMAQAQAGEDDAEDMDEEFDLSELRDAEESADFEPFAADVTIECLSVQGKKSERTGDRYLRMEWVVTEGEHEKAHIWDTVMLQGKGVGMGKRKLNTMGADITALKRSDLVGIICTARTKIKKDKTGEYDDKTEIKKYTGRVSGAVSTSELPD